MPPLPTYRRRRIPSANIGAAPLPVSAAQQGQGAIGRGMAALGGGISNIGQRLFQAEALDQQNRDSLAGIELKSDIEAAETNYKAKIANDGDTANWPKYRDEVFARIKPDEYEWGSSRARERARVTVEGWSENFLAESNLNAIAKRNKDNITATEVAYISGLSIGDDSGEGAYRDALKTKYSPEIVDILVAGAKVDGLKGKAINLAATGEFDAARKLTNSIPSIPPKEREALLNSINAMESKAGTESENLSNAAIETAYSSIRDGNVDIDGMMDAIASNPNISDEDSNEATVKIKTFFSTWNSLVKKNVVTDNPTMVAALRIEHEVGKGNISLDEGLRQYAVLEKNNKINPTHNTGFLNGIFSAAESAQKNGTQEEVVKNLRTTLDSLYGADKPIKSATDYMKMDNAITVFAKENPDATVKQYEEFWTELTKRPTSIAWWSSIFAVATLGIIGDVGREEEDFTSESIAENLQRVEGLKALPEIPIPVNPATAVVGDTIVQNGGTWKLIEKGNTPSGDKWQLQ